MVGPLEKWFLKAHREMPWRKTRDPYAIWISEVMLQQTQVTTVIPYYEKFLAKLPTLEALAKSPIDTVLSLWSGLGYYSRARNLQKGAQYLLAHHGGQFPKDRATLLETPGIGPYTAGAILSIAFDLPVPIVDGNVQRVFARYFGWREAIESKASQNFFWEKAEAWVKMAKSPRALNQALMELGATVCTKGTPRCEICPLVSGCVAFKKDLTSSLPVRKPKREKVDLHWLAVRFERDGAVFLQRNPAGEWWEDLYDLPRGIFEKPAELNELVEKLLERDGARRLGTKKHAVTHHRLHVTGLRVPTPHKRPRLGAEPLAGEWFKLEEVSALPLSALARKVLMLE